MWLVLVLVSVVSCELSSEQLQSLVDDYTQHGNINRAIQVLGGVTDDEYEAIQQHLAGIPKPAPNGDFDLASTFNTLTQLFKDGNGLEGVAESLGLNPETVQKVLRSLQTAGGPSAPSAQTQDPMSDLLQAFQSRMDGGDAPKQDRKPDALLQMSKAFESLSGKQSNFDFKKIMEAMKSLGGEGSDPKSLLASLGPLMNNPELRKLLDRPELGQLLGGMGMGGAPDPGERLRMLQSQFRQHQDSLNPRELMSQLSSDPQARRILAQMGIDPTSDDPEQGEALLARLTQAMAMGGIGGGKEVVLPDYVLWGVVVATFAAMGAFITLLVRVRAGRGQKREKRSKRTKRA